MKTDDRCPPISGELAPLLQLDVAERRTTRRQTIGLVVVLFVEFALVAAIAIAVSGCSAEPVVDETELDCNGELGCSCSSNDDCAAYGLGGLRGRCSLGLCTTACLVDDDCAALPAATCGPLTVAGVRECTVACDELDEPCDELGLAGAACIVVAIDSGTELVCGGAP